MPHLYENRLPGGYFTIEVARATSSPTRSRCSSVAEYRWALGLAKGFPDAYNRHWHPMWQHIALGSLLVLTTTLVHAGGTVLALRGLKQVQRVTRTHLGRSFAISILVLGMFLVSLLEALLWAYAYLRVGVIGDFESAVVPQNVVRREM